MSADSPRRTGDNVKQSRGTIVTPQVVSDRSILDSAIGFINEVTLAHPIQTDTKNTIAWARFETAADISDPRFSDDWETDSDVGCGGGNLVVPPLLLILGYNVGAQVWAIPNNGEAVEVLSWRHGIVTNLRMLPTPTLPTTVDEHERADESLDAFANQRPLMALVESSSCSSSATSGSPPQFCTVNFISLKTGTQVKTLKYKNTVIDILVNRSSIVITFHECLAILDANTLEDRWSINTCYPSPGINPNPVALGARWLAYAQHKLFNSKRSGGGWDGEALASYTSTVLNAAKSLGKGLRDLGGQVAAGLTGSSAGAIKSNFSDTQSGDSKQPGVVTIIDIMEKRQISQHDSSGGNSAGNPSSSSSSCSSDLEADGPAKIVHFIAHSEPIAAMEFDYSGMLLITADRRGHDFHVFRIQPHPLSSALSAVHHLYVLHRGDTSAKVQNITFSLDSRWVAVSTLRGTTHVFPIAPYGGIIGARSHGSYRVVNQMSNYLRSAGLPADERSDSPVAHTESTYPYPNRTMPPFPRPIVVAPLAQLRQPFALDSPPRSASIGSSSNISNTGTQRQRLSSLSDDNGKPLSICAIFAESRSWLLDPPNVDETSQRVQRKALDSLFVMAGHGALIQYDLDTKVPSTVSKEWNDAPIELVVEAKAQWNLAQRKEGPQEVIPPLSSDNWLLRSREPIHMSGSSLSDRNADTESGSDDEAEDRREPWLSQVERTTYMGPGRRLWMGPQFSFWTYEEPSGSTLSDKDFDRDSVDIDKCEVKSTSATAALSAIGPIMEGRSSPLNMSGNRASPLQMTACSWSSLEPSPKLERLRHDSDSSVSETSAFIRNNARIKEEMAEAMKESTSNVSQEITPTNQEENDDDIVRRMKLFDINNLKHDVHASSSMLGPTATSLKATYSKRTLNAMNKCNDATKEKSDTLTSHKLADVNQSKNSSILQRTTPAAQLSQQHINIDTNLRHFTTSPNAAKVLKSTNQNNDEKLQERRIHENSIEKSSATTATAESTTETFPPTAINDMNDLLIHNVDYEDCRKSDEINDKSSIDSDLISDKYNAEIISTHINDKDNDYDNAGGDNNNSGTL